MQGEWGRRGRGRHCKHHDAHNAFGRVFAASDIAARMSGERLERNAFGAPRREKRRHDPRDLGSSILTTISGIHVSPRGFFRYDCSGSYARWNANRADARKCAARLPYLIPRRLRKKYVRISPEGAAKTSWTLVSFCAVRNARFRASLSLFICLFESKF